MTLIARKVHEDFGTLKDGKSWVRRQHHIKARDTLVRDCSLDIPGEHSAESLVRTYLLTSTFERRDIGCSTGDEDVFQLVELMDFFRLTELANRFEYSISDRILIFRSNNLLLSEGFIKDLAGREPGGLDICTKYAFLGGSCLIL